MSAQKVIAAAKTAVTQLQTTFTTKVGPTVVTGFKDLMARNQQYVVKDPVAAEKLGKQFIFTNLSRIPTHLQQAQAEYEVAKQVWAKRSELPLSQAAVYAAFGAEVFAWFCVGEIIGRGGGIIDYK